MNEVASDMEGALKVSGGDVEDASQRRRTTHAFRIGEVDVHPTLLRVTRTGRATRLEPKVMEVLLALASRAGSVVSRQELQTEVWGTPHISEDLPRRAISALRKVFGDDARNPRYIETIPRSGYRLLPAVVPTGPVPTNASASAGASSGRRFDAAGMLTAAAALLAAAFFFVGLRARPDIIATTRTVPLTTQPGLEYDPAMAPDGSRVVFLRAADLEAGTPVSLELQMIGESRSLPLTTLPADLDHPIESPAWSPDGARVAFRRWQRDTGWDLYSVSALGGAERRLRALGRNATSGLDWSPDGRTLVFGRSPELGAPLAVQTLDLEHDRLDTLTKPPSTAIGDRWPVFAPDGSTLAFARFFGADAAEILVIDSDGSGERSLLAGRHKVADLDWSADGQWLLVSTFEAGRHQVRQLSARQLSTRGLATVKLAEAGENARWLSVPRTAERWVYARAEFELSVREIDLEHGTATPVHALSSTFFDEALDLSPEGDRLAMVSTRSGGFELWVHDLPGGQSRRLSAFGHARLGRPAWVDDGTRIVIDANPDGGFDLFAVDVDGGSPHQLTDHPADERMPSASSDGKRLVFASNRTGDWEIWTLSSEGGDALRLTEGGGYVGRLSGDGEWLYFTRFRESGLWRQPLVEPGGTPSDRAEKILTDEPKPWEQGNWLLDDDAIWVVTRDDDGRISLSLFDHDGTPIRQLPIEGTPVQPSLTHAPRTGHAMLVSIDRIESDLVLVESAQQR